jgi:hypothetical protein
MEMRNGIIDGEEEEEVDVEKIATFFEDEKGKFSHIFLNICTYTAKLKEIDVHKLRNGVSVF